eukprot:10870-Heterococcus_DN1.PRE.1
MHWQRGSTAWGNSPDHRAESASWIQQAPWSARPLCSEDGVALSWACRWSSRPSDWASFVIA